MKLEVNNSHKSALMGGLNKNKKRIVASILGAVIGMSFFSGATRVKAIDKEENYEDDNEVVTTVDNSISEQSNEIYEVQDNNNILELSDEDVIEIEDGIKYFVSKAVGKDENDFITVGDLKGITDLDFDNFSDISNIFWINYCINLESLSLSLDMPNLNQIISLPNLKTLNISLSSDLDINANHLDFILNCPNLESLNIYGVNIEGYRIEFNANNFEILRNCPNLKRLSIDCCTVAENTVDLMREIGIEELSLNRVINFDADYKKLSFLKRLYFNSANIYDALMSFTSEDYNYLIASGVEVKSFFPGTIDAMVEVNDRLDEIVKSLNVSKDATDQEKLDAILMYVLENFSYDEDVSYALDNNIDCSDLTRSFYYYGKLYGALEKDSQICGNYAAMVEALANRLDLKSYYARGDAGGPHAWNLVCVENYYYLVDATFLDNTRFDISKLDSFSYIDYVLSSYTGKEREIAETILKRAEENGDYIKTRYSTVMEEGYAQDFIKEGKIEDLRYYMDDPYLSKSHHIMNLPSYITLRPLEDVSFDYDESYTTEYDFEKDYEYDDYIEKSKSIDQNFGGVKLINQNDGVTIEKAISQNKVVDITNKKFEIKIGQKTWIIPGAVVIGLLTGLGFAIRINKNKIKEELFDNNEEIHRRIK